MSYQVLARKWCPRNFTTLVGQEHVVKALMHALEQQRLHRAYLFTGTRDVGKTTLSRILTRPLNCVGADGQGGIPAQPHGVYRACTEIDAGRFVDHIEMDAASNRGADEMAQLLDRATCAPTGGRFKVYMIGEVHMLTSHVFNAMLKMLEESPEHVKFILVATDPQKIPVTVLLRCLRFNLKQMLSGHIASHLNRTLGEEGIAHEPNTLRLLAAAAQDLIRDALSLTDQTIAYSAGEVSEAAVHDIPGVIDQNYLVRLLDALVDENGAALIEIADEVTGRSLSFPGVLRDLVLLLQKIALAQVVLAAVQDGWPEADDVRRPAERLDAQSVQLFYQFANPGRNELAFAPDEYAGFTMTVLRMLVFQSGHSGGDAAPPSGGGGGRRTTPLIASPAASTRPVVTATAPVAAPAARAALVVMHPEPVVEAPRAADQATPPAPVSIAAVSDTQATAPARRPPTMEALTAARQASSHGRGSASAPAATPVTASVARPVAPIVGPRPNTAATTAAVVSPPQHGEQPVAVTAPADDGPSLWDEMPGEFASPSFEEMDVAFAGWGAASGVRPGVPKSATGPAPIKALATAPTSAKTIAPEPVAVATSPDLSTSGLATFDGNWPALAVSLPIRDLVQQLAYQNELAAVEGVTMRLRMPLPPLTDANVVERLEAVLAEHFGTPVRVACGTGSVCATAAAIDVEQRAECQRNAEDTITTNLFVQALIRDFAAQIVPGSIQPHAH